MDPCLQIAFLTLCCTLRLHQVVCGSKYLVRGESALDHVDLLVSSRHWPPVYVVDMATPVALCADLCYPDLTNQMWGRNQGCFSSPTEPPVVRSLLKSHKADHASPPGSLGRSSVNHPVSPFSPPVFCLRTLEPVFMPQISTDLVCEATACHLVYPG